MGQIPDRGAFIVPPSKGEVRPFAPDWWVQQCKSRYVRTLLGSRGESVPVLNAEIARVLFWFRWKMFFKRWFHARFYLHTRKVPKTTAQKFAERELEK